MSPRFALRQASKCCVSRFPPPLSALLRCCSLLLPSSLHTHAPLLFDPLTLPQQDEREEGTAEPSQDRSSDRSSEQVKLSADLDLEGRERNTNTNTNNNAERETVTSAATAAAAGTAGSLVGEESAAAEGDRQSMRGIFFFLFGWYVGKCVNFSVVSVSMYVNAYLSPKGQGQKKKTKIR